MAAAEVPAPQRQPWIFDSRRDLALVVLTPLLIIPVAAGAQTRLSIEQISLIVLAFGAMGHHLPGMLRAYGDRELFARFRARFILAPILLMALCLYLSFTDQPAIETMAIAWGIWHGLAQVYGFSRIYDAKAGISSRRGALLDRGMCIAWFAGGVVFSDGRMFGLLEYFWQTGGPLVSAAFIRELRWILGSGMAAVTAVWIAHQLLQWRKGTPPSPVKLTFMLSSFAFWWFCMVGIERVILGIALFEVAHDVQYLAIVWLYNTRRVEQGGRLGGFTRFLFRRSGALVGLYVGMVFAYGAIGLGSRLTTGPLLDPILGAVVIFSGFLHFYYDSFIWSVSDRKTSQTLDLGSAAAVERWRAPAWVGHAARWSYLAVPLLVLTALSGTNAPPVSRYMEATAAFPSIPEPEYQLAEFLLSRGDVDGAERSFERALALRPDYARAQAGLGHVALARRSFGEAERSFQRALELDENTALAWTGLGTLHFERNELGPARSAVDRARQLAPLDGRALVLDARLRSREGQLDRAEELYREAASAFPTRPEIPFELGGVYARQGRLEEAARQFERALELHPSDPRARRELQHVRERIAAES